MSVYSGSLKLFTVAALAAASTTAVAAQAPPPEPIRAAAAQAVTPNGTGPAGPATQPDSAQPSPPGDATAQAGQATSRQAALEQEQAAKALQLHPYVENSGEKIFRRVDTILAGGTLRYHPFFDSAYSGGGFTLGMGHVNYLSGYNYLDLRGSFTFTNYKRLEAEFIAPRMFHRRAKLSLLGGYRDATQVGFYGVGNDTSKDDRANYRFKRPYGSGLFTIFPTRRYFMLRGGVEFTRWSQQSGQGSFPSVETIYTPDKLPGLGAEIDYLHTEGSVGLDWRTAPDYTRRGGFLAATVHDYSDHDDAFGFTFVQYEAIEHIPILRETWVLSLRARMQHAAEKDNQQIPYFLLPSVGGGSSLRGFSSYRFRDQNSLLLQGEYRIMVNRYLDLAFFYDTGKVAARTKDLDLDGLHDDYGFGFRFHGPFSTPLRIELARSAESRISFIFSTGASF